MQSYYTTYKTLVDSGNYDCEYRAIINGVTYDKNVIFRIRTSTALFDATSESFPGIGHAVAQELDLEFKNEVSIPKRADIQIQLRLTDGTTTTDWCNKGKFYIDTRKTSKRSGNTTVHAYDAMIKAEQVWYGSYSAGSTIDDRTLATDIASKIGVSLFNAYGILNSSSFPFDEINGRYTCRELLQFIAIRNAGNFWITDTDEQLRFQRIVPITRYDLITNIDLAVKDYDYSDALENITKVVLEAGDETFEAGDDTGLTATYKLPFADQNQANLILSCLNYIGYKPFEASSAYINPFCELYDVVSLDNGNLTSRIYSRDINFTVAFSADISAPYDEEMQHEFHYDSPLDKKVDKSDYNGNSIVSKLNDEATTEKISADKIEGGGGGSGLYVVEYGTGVNDVLYRLWSNGMCEVWMDGYLASREITVESGGVFKSGEILMSCGVPKSNYKWTDVYAFNVQLTGRKTTSVTYNVQDIWCSYGGKIAVVSGGTTIQGPRLRVYSSTSKTTDVPISSYIVGTLEEIT